MNLNVLLRGQSNAALLGNIHGDEIIATTQWLLGFDGVNDSVKLIFAYDNTAGSTAFSGTSFLTQWLSATPAGGWQVGSLEQSLLNYIATVPAAQKAAPTAVVWLHNEYDSMYADLTPATWTSAVRFDAGLVRQAFGQTAASMPYLFVSAIPFTLGTDAGHQSIRIGMEQLAADPAFNGGIAARALDADMTFDDSDGNPATPNYGGWHQSFFDAHMTAQRIGLSLAQEWSAYAKPGSPIALAGGNIDDLGPHAVQATLVNPRVLVVRTEFDGPTATRLAPLDAAAAQGVGWSVIAPDGRQIKAVGAELAPDAPNGIFIGFAEAIPAGAKLFYGYGYGRLAAADGSGHGHAVYDNVGLPLWVDAQGLAINGLAAAAPPETAIVSTLVGTAGGIYAATAGDDNWVFQPGSGIATIEGFDPAHDTLTFSGIPSNSLIYWDPASVGVPGLGITWAGGQGSAVLPGVTSVPDSHILFA